MNFKKISFIASLAMAMAMSAFAQEAPADDDGEWASAPESSEVSADSTTGTYDGSADSEFADDEEYASAYARYKSQTTKKTEIERQRTEGFARPVLLGIRAQGGINTFFGENSDGWKIGFQGGAGLMLKMNLGIKNLSLVPELTFNYRRYTYEKEMADGLYTNESVINIFIFEIPIIVRYEFESTDFYVGLGLNLGLKLNGSSSFENVSNNGDRTPHPNPDPVMTSSMEIGAGLDLGYMISRNTYINLRVVQCFTSLLNKILVEAQSFQNSSLLTFQTTAGISFLF